MGIVTVLNATVPWMVYKFWWAKDQSQEVLSILDAQRTL